MWDKIDLSLLGGLIAAVIGLFGVIGYIIKNNNNAKNKKDAQILEMLKQQVNNLTIENQELRKRVDELQKELISLLKE